MASSNDLKTWSADGTGCWETGNGADNNGIVAEVCRGGHGICGSCCNGEYAKCGHAMNDIRDHESILAPTLFEFHHQICAFIRILIICVLCEYSTCSTVLRKEVECLITNRYLARFRKYPIRDLQLTQPTVFPSPNSQKIPNKKNPKKKKYSETSIMVVLLIQY